MQQISFWAKKHPWTARLIIIGCYIGLNIIGVITGHLLKELSITLSPLFLFMAVIIFLAAFIAYPSGLLKGKTLSKEAFYIRQKSCDFILISCTFLMIVYGGNHPGGLPFNFTMSQAAIQFNPITPTEKANARTYKTFEAFKASMKNKEGKTLKWKERKKLFKAQVRVIKKAPGLSKGAKIFLTILCAYAASMLLYLVAGLACSIACGGSEGLGFVVAVGGLVAVCFLIKWADTAIWGKKKKKQLPAEKNTEKTDKYY